MDQNADFLILEVNERAIKLGIIDDVEFDIRVLTNIIEKSLRAFYFIQNKTDNLFSFKQQSSTYLIYLYPSH